MFAESRPKVLRSETPERSSVDKGGLDLPLQLYMIYKTTNWEKSLVLRIAAASLLAIASSQGAMAQEILHVDASAPVSDPVDGYLKVGSATSPDGTVLGVDSNSLTLNGKPWMPVMGEIHFVRLPEAEWDASLAKIKAAGVDIVATYLFWNYHEETPGSFNWSGDRDLRKFVELAQKNGLKVIVRLGPWSHGEVRYGGVPDWMVHELPLRGSDPQYMGFVDRYWGQIADQLKGLLWKDGGPVVGVQLENEYNLTGRGQGRQHIADLKALAIRHGLDVPFYTVTGWDGAVYPRGEVLPVFGGYPDEPWSTSAQRLPPKETYAFRFDSRVSGDLGAQTIGGPGDADSDMANTPFFGAEYAGGVPTMYRRRPVLVPEDIASMLPVQLGSGVNLYGYYMFHGGRNLISRTTLEESTLVGGYNDTPIIDYDFQAPFGAFGQANPVEAYIRPFHYMLQSYGDQLVPTKVRQPEIIPSASNDLATLRWSARSAGDTAFVFVNNHVRQYAMSDHPAVQFSLKLPSKSVTFPSEPVTVRNNAYFIWPVGLDLDGQSLDWASAQPLTRVESGADVLHIFAATDGIVPEFAFPVGTKVRGGNQRKTSDHLLVRVGNPETRPVLTIETPTGKHLKILVLSETDSRKLWHVEADGAQRVVISDDQLVASNDEQLAFTSIDDPDFSFSIWPPLEEGLDANLRVSRPKRDGIFETYSAHAKPRSPSVTYSMIREPGEAPPVRIGGVAGAAVQPYPEAFGRAAGAWTIDISKDALDGLDDAFLKIDWAGDIGRLFAGPEMIEDFFFDGREWRIGLRRHMAALGKPLTLRVLPLRSDAAIYIDDDLKPEFGPNGQVARVNSIGIDPQYRLTVSFSH